MAPPVTGTAFDSTAHAAALAVAAERSAEGRIRTPPRTGRDALYVWALLYGVEACLARPLASFVPRGAHPNVWRVATNDKRLTVEHLLLGVAPGGGTLTIPWLSPAHQEALAVATGLWLQTQAADRRNTTSEAQRRAAARGPLPADPTVRALAEHITAARDAQAASAVLPPADAVKAASLTLLEDPPRVVHVAAYPDGYGLRRARVEVRVDPATLRASPPIACDQCSAATCKHRLTALEALLDLLHADDDAARHLARVAATPTWGRTLDALDSTLKALAKRAGRAAQDVLVSFRLHARRGDGWTLSMAVHKPMKRGGGWTKGAAVGRDRLRELMQHPPAGVPRDVLEHFLGVAEACYSGGQFSTEDVGDILARLAGYPHVYLADDLDHPVAVHRATVEVTVMPVGPDGSLRLAPAVEGGVVLDAKWWGPFFNGAAYIGVDREARTCLVAEPDLALRAVAAALRDRDMLFPPESHDVLRERLEGLASLVAVRLPPELLGEKRPPETRIVLRLQPTAIGGLHAEVVARALPGARAWPPGEGQRVVSATAGETRVHAERDLAHEVRRARALVAALPVPEGVAADTWRWELTDAEATLSFVEAVQATAETATDVDVEWPEGARVRVTARATPADLRLRVTDGRDWFGLEGEVEVDGARVQLALLLDAARRQQRYVSLGKGQYLALSEELRARLATTADVVHAGRRGIEAGLAAAHVIEDLVDGVAELEQCARWRKHVKRLKSARALDPRLPDTFEASLRPYQEEGFKWLSRLAAWGVGACLADDMGLGKTVQALAVLTARRHEGPALVVAPTSVCRNWVRETERFAPGLTPRLLHGADRDATFATLAPGDLLVTSYGLLLRHAEALAAIRFATLVLDEAQAVKNAATHRARAVRDLDADWRLALTGTPLENHLGELWSLFRAVSPGLLGSHEQFRDRFSLPIERRQDGERRKALARVVQPFILRRTKAEVAPELPPRTEITLAVTLSPAERRLYEDVRLAAAAELAGVGQGGGGGDGPQARFRVLAAITRLRQLACHPRLYDATWTKGAAKLERFTEIVDELRDNGHRALVFSQFTSHLALVREALDARGVRYLYLDGATPEAERQRRVDAFQAGEGDLFLISLKAGGTGLNLTAADYVVHLDPWWNPAVEDQATDRAHRIGQERPVTVYRLVSRGTIEEAILALHAEKRDLVAGVLDGTDAAGALSTEELLALIRSEAAPAMADDVDDEGHENGNGNGHADASADAAPPAPVVPAPREPARATATRDPGAADPKARLDAFAEALARAGYAEGSVRAYKFAVSRFLRWVAERGEHARAAAAPEALIATYLLAVQSGEESGGNQFAVLRSGLGRYAAHLAAAAAAAAPNS